MGTPCEVCLATSETHRGMSLWGVIYIIVGLSALLVPTNRAMRRPFYRGASNRLAPRFLCIQQSPNNLTHTCYMTHTGRLIQSVLQQQGKTVTWFAQQLCCTRTNVYKIFQKKNLDIEIIWRASSILEYDFFQALSTELNNQKRTGGEKT